MNHMLAAECYKKRWDKGLTFFEFNYMIMQAYDFYTLHKNYNCVLEMGGDDQWSNMLAGVELIRRKDQKPAFCITCKLLTTSDGRKMGKTERAPCGWMRKNVRLMISISTGAMWTILTWKNAWRC